MTIEERLNAIEARLDQLRVPPIRDELLAVRDTHGARLGAIEARLGAIEHEVGETTSWMARRFDEVDDRLTTILMALGGQP